MKVVLFAGLNFSFFSIELIIYSYLETYGVSKVIYPIQKFIMLSCTLY